MLTEGVRQVPKGGKCDGATAWPLEASAPHAASHGREGPRRTRARSCRPGVPGPSPHNLALNKRILDVHNVCQLVALLEACHSEFNDVNVATSWRTLQALAGRQSQQRRCNTDGSVHKAVALLEVATAQRVSCFDAKCCSMVLYALAKLSRKDMDVLVGMLMERATGVSCTMNPQDVSNLLWAFANLRAKPTAALIAALNEHIQQSIHMKFKPQEIANTFWAASTLQLKLLPGLTSKLSTRAIAVADQFKAQEVANLLMAFASLGTRPSSALVAAMTDQATHLEFKAQEISNILWAFATLKMKPAANLLDHLVARAAVLLAPDTTGSGSASQNFKAQEIATALWSFATLRIHPTLHLVQLISDRAESISKELSAQSIAMILWSFTTLSCLTPSTSLLRVLADRTKEVSGLLNDQDIANILWAACGMLEAEDFEVRKLVRCLMDAVATQALKGPVKFSKEGLSSLHQCFLSCETKRDAMPASVFALKQIFGRMSAAAFAGSGARPSQVQRSVSVALRGMGLAVRDEYTCNVSNYSIDCLVSSDNTLGYKTVAVEVDGPAHFLDNMAPTGATVLKRRHLRLLGYDVAVVSYTEWAVLKDKTARANFLREMLYFTPDQPAKQSAF